MRILLIEDDKALCQVLQPTLQAAGFASDCCHTGADGLHLLKTGYYDACILDRMLPELDGLTLLKSARADGVSIPVLMLTALGQIGDRVEGLDAGADDYLAKPFDNRELLARLRALVRRPADLHETAHRIACGDLVLDTAQLTLTGPSSTVTLSRRECDLLAAALTATCRMAQIEAVSGADLVFANTVSAIEDAVTENNLVRDSWLASQEAAGRLVLYMEDNGHPLVFSGGWTPADARTTLVALAREQAVSAGLNPDRLHRQKVNFSLNGAQLSGSYTCTAMLLPSEQMSSAVLLYIIRDMGPLHDRLWAMVWQYTALWAAGALILAFLSHWMVDRALRPTAQAMQKQREFVAAAGHELRSPLTVLKASLQAAQAPETAHLAPQFLSHAASEVDRLSRLTEDLLILAGGDAGVLRTSLAQINTDTFLVELYERFVPVARDHGHSLTLHLPDNPLPALHADAQRLEQLFAVLLNNAFEYSPAGTPVEILAELPPSGGLHIAVVDHGPGVPDAEKHRIFDRFARGDRSRTDKTHFGLGLAVASQIASLHGAILRVRDTPGGGATFVVEWRNNHVLDRSSFS